MNKAAGCLNDTLRRGKYLRTETKETIYTVSYFQWECVANFVTKEDRRLIEWTER